MHIYWLPFLGVIAITAGIDFYIWREMKKSRLLSGFLSWLHVALAVVAQVAAVALLLWPQPSGGTRVAVVAVMMMVMWGYFLFYVPKAVWAALYPLHKAVKRQVTPRRIVKGFAVAIALVALILMAIGTLHTPHTREVSQVAIASPRLPMGFDGYRIVHISDLHLGTYGSDTAFVAACVRDINDLQPDLIVFTGDLVNTSVREVEPFRHCLGLLHAPDGVIAVLGNHDYDDYAPCTR